MKTLLFFTLLISFSNLSYAQNGCSLKLAKKIAKSILTAQSENNKVEGKLSFKLGSKKWGYQTFEYTEDYIANKMDDSLIGESTKQHLHLLLQVLNNDSRTRLYRVAQQQKSGSGKCGYGALCTSSTMLVTAKELDNGYCFIEGTNEER